MHAVQEGGALVEMRCSVVAVQAFDGSEIGVGLGKAVKHEVAAWGAAWSVGDRLRHVSVGVCRQSSQGRRHTRRPVCHLRLLPAQRAQQARHA